MSLKNAAHKKQIFDARIVDFRQGRYIQLVKDGICHSFSLISYARLASKGLPSWPLRARSMNFAAARSAAPMRSFEASLCAGIGLRPGGGSDLAAPSSFGTNDR